MAKGVGVYIGRNEVIAVSAMYAVNGPVIKSFAIEPINPEGPQEPMVGKEAHKLKKLSPESRAVIKALGKIKEPGAFVTAAVSSFHVATRHFIMPAVPKKDEAGAVRHEASRYIPFKVSESVMDYSVHLTHRNVFSVTATAIRAEVVETCLQDLRSASAKVLMVEPVYSAVGRAFSALSMVGKANKCQGFVILQSDGNVNITLASKGIVYLSRDFILTGNIEEDKARFSDELRASLDYFYKLTGGEAVGQLFLAGSGDLKLWVEHLERAFNYTIRFDVANLPNAKNIPSEVLGSVLIAFGLAIRSLGFHSPLGDVKLLPKEERRSSPEKLLMFLGLECLAIFLVFALVRLAIFQPYLGHLEGKNQSILAPLHESNSAFATRSLDDIMAEKEKIEKRVTQLNNFFGGVTKTSSFLVSLGQGLPQSVLLNYISLEDTGMKEESRAAKAKKRLNIRGVCYLGSAEKETNTVSAWVKSLGGKKAISEYFGEIKLEEIKREKAGNKDFTRFLVIGE